MDCFLLLLKPGFSSVPKRYRCSFDQRTLDSPSHVLIVFPSQYAKPKKLTLKYLRKVRFKKRIMDQDLINTGREIFIILLVCCGTWSKGCITASYLLPCIENHYSQLIAPRGRDLHLGSHLDHWAHSTPMVLVTCFQRAPGVTSVILSL